jgi:hypothetical protein
MNGLARFEMADTQQRAPDVRQVEQIAAHSDPILRNLQITQCYHELSAALARRTGLSANWCTFATWASKQAGQTIRKEDFARTLDSLRDDILESAQAAQGMVVSAQQIGARGSAEEIQRSVWDALNPAAALDRASDAVGRGNKKVFEEIGFEFTRFLSACLSDATFDADKIAHFCDELRPGDPPGGQRYLRHAFACYYRSFFEPDAKARAELLLLANVEIGFHEQTRLQPEITEALDAAFVDPQQFTPGLIKAIFPYRGWLALARLFFTRLFRRPTQFDQEVNALVTAAQKGMRQMITQHIMAITLPRGVRLWLGKDLNADFPPSLKQITDSELLVLLRQIDPTPDSLRGTGTADWANLAQRIHFIADMFRCYQESQDLFEPPFTPDQVTALQADLLPVGTL